ncbi:MAG: head-tail adaptor protein [Holosporaceae bacterium]|nr:MAG: head-tail adaptor protein [Holosporaceae bacterium]
MHINELTELLDIETGAETPDDQGGMTTTWTKGTPIWARVTQRLKPRSGAWEGGQAHYEVSYEVWMDSAVPLPEQFRVHWQGDVFYPLHRPVYQSGGLWKMVTIAVRDGHDD